VTVRGGERGGCGRAGAGRPRGAVTDRGQRSTLRRPLEIDRLIREGTCLCADRLAERFEVDRRTIVRDLEWLRDQMQAPLRFDRGEGRYVYDSPSFSLPAVVMTEGELVGLLLASRVLEEYRGTSWEGKLLHALEKLTRFLPDHVTVNLRAAADAVSVRVPSARPLDLDVLKVVVAATLEHVRLAIRYRKLGHDVAADREVDPYHVLAHAGGWYLVAHCHTAGELRTFALPRIESVRPTGTDFRRPPDFSIDRYLGDCFGIFRGSDSAGEARYLVRLRFDDLAAPYVREEVRKAEVSRKEVRGGLEVAYRLSDLTEITSWVLSWSGHVHVLEPAELRKRVRAQLRAGLKLNGGSR
jgi:predicted DNA-binding transcriptional regulator YafY